MEVAREAKRWIDQAFRNEIVTDVVNIEAPFGGERHATRKIKAVGSDGKSITRRAVACGDTYSNPRSQVYQWL